MIKCKNCHQDLPVNTRICGHCGTLVHKPPTEYFYTPTIYFLFLYCTTLGLYHAYWFYKNWVAIKKASHEKRIYPFLRALFAIISCWGLLKRIYHDAATYGYKHQKSAYTAAFLFIGSYVLLWIFDKSNLNPVLVLVICVPIVLALQASALLIAQRAIKFHNKHTIPGYSTKRQLTNVELVWITTVCSSLITGIRLGLSSAGLLD